MHPSTYLAYAAWLSPILVPFLLAYLWRKRLQRRGAFVLVGTLCALGVVFVSMFLLGFLLARLNSLFGLSLRGAVYGGVPALIWFNGIFMLVFNLVVVLLSLTVLARVFSDSAGKVPVRKKAQ